MKQEKMGYKMKKTVLKLGAVMLVIVCIALSLCLTACGIGESKSTGSESLSYELNEDGVSYSVTGMGECTKRNIVIPSEYKGLPVTAIGESAFVDYNDTYRLKSVTIPDSVTTIGDHAFYKCDGLKNITIGKNVTSIGNSAFSGCDSLESVIIPDGVTSINRAFENCQGLKNITIPDSVTFIGESAFCMCSNLTNIAIPNSISFIGDNAFEDCTSLASATIPNSVTYIGHRAVDSCTSLVDLRYAGTKREWKKISLGENWRENSAIRSVTCANGVIKGAFLR